MECKLWTAGSVWSVRVILAARETLQNTTQTVTLVDSDVWLDKTVRSLVIPLSEPLFAVAHCYVANSLLFHFHKLFSLLAKYVRCSAAHICANSCHR